MGCHIHPPLYAACQQYGSTHLYASEMVTASGRPSGTATTTMVTPYRKNCTGPSLLISLMGKPWFTTIHLGGGEEEGGRL